MKLTLRTIQAAAAKDQEYVIWDHELSCFGLRVRQGGGKTFIARTRVGRGRDAKKVTITIGKPEFMTVEDARRKARALIAEAAEGKAPETAAPKVQAGPKTVGDLCDLWLEKGATRMRLRGKLAGKLRDPKNIAIDRGRINAHIIPLLGKVKLSDLTASVIEGFRDAVARGDTKQLTKTKPRGLRRVSGGEGTATRTLRLFSSILSFGVRERALGANPAIGVEKTPDRSLERFLSPDEMRRLGETLVAVERAGAPAAGIAIIRMLALSGARKGEVEQLRWPEVDLRTGFLRLATSKTGAKLIPITGPMRAILEARAELGRDGYVFVDRTGESHFQGTPKLWVKIRNAANLDDVRLHDLRHSAASFGLAGGLGLEVIGKLLGHADVKTTRRYAHLSEGHVKAAAESMADGIADLLSPSSK